MVEHKVGDILENVYVVVDVHDNGVCHVCPFTTSKKGWIYIYDKANRCFIREDLVVSIPVEDWVNHTPECKVCGCRGKILDNGIYTMEMDACVPYIPGSKGLCCGHGNVGKAYYADKSGLRFEGQKALDYINKLKGEV